MDEFVIFTVIKLKLLIISVVYDGNAVFGNHMYAVIRCIITEVMTLFDESSKFIDVNCKFHRCGRPSCLGSACKMCLHEDFYRVAIVSQKQKPIGFCLVITVITTVMPSSKKVCSVHEKSLLSARKKSA